MYTWFSYAQTFIDATWLSTAVEYNFSTQFAQPNGWKPVAMFSEVTPQDELNFYGTNDNGATWSLISSIAQTPNTYGGNMISVGATLIAGACNYTSANNFYISTDNGLTWTNTINIPTNRCIHMDFLELANGDILGFVSTYANTADVVYRSTDGWNSWAILSSMPVNNNSYKVSAIQLANGDLIYSQASPQSPFWRILRSTDNGATRTQQVTTLSTSYNTSLIQAENWDVIASFAVLAWWGGSQVRRSTDNWITWTAVWSPWGAVSYYGTDLILLENWNILLDLVSTTTNDSTYISEDNGSTRAQITTRIVPVSATNYESDMFQLENGELLISNPHWWQRPVILKHEKPPTPTLDTPLDGYSECSLAWINGTASLDTNTIYYEVLDASNSVIFSGTWPITWWNFSISFASPLTTAWTYTVNVYEDDMITLSDPETASITIFGESPTEYTISPLLVSDVDENRISISYSSFISWHTFTSAPIVLATPQTQNNWDNYPIPRIRNVTATWFDLSICLDTGSITCDPNPNAEDIGIFVVDVDAALCIDNIDIGTTIIDTDGTDTAFTFNDTFTNEPYVFTTPQTSSQWNNIAATAWVDDNALDVNGSDFIWCVHQNGNAGNIDTCTTWQPQETLWRVAIDPTLFTMTNYQDNTETISNSTRTNINFAPAYTWYQPVVMVTQNSDNGWQDPQYAWAKDVTETNAYIRYCEADAQWVCNTHTTELVRWFSLPVFTYCGDGFTQNPNSNSESETCDDGNTISWDWCSDICEIETTWDICIFSPSSFNFSWVIITNNTPYQIEQQFTNSFQIEDTKWSNSWYYTTLQISDFSWNTYGEIIPNSNLERYATWISLLSGDVNTDVILATWRNSYRTADVTYTFIIRNSGVNSGRIWLYETFPFLRLTIPPYTKSDIYTADMTYTLFEN